MRAWLVGLLVVASSTSACKKDAAANAVGAANVPLVAPPLLIQWSANATAYRGTAGRRVSVLCPANGTIGSAWGTDVYSDDSSICTAALHSGRVTTQGGGVVSIEVSEGRSSYSASSRNGVTTSAYGPWQGSFTIVGGASPGLATAPAGGGGPVNLANAIPIEWGTQGRSVVHSGESQLVFCRPMGRARSVWGTDVYTSDSSICAAAVHAGVITMMLGGPVLVTYAAGRGGYPASRRNGVRSQSWGSWGASFVVAAPGTAATPGK